MNFDLFGSTRFVADTADCDQLQTLSSQDVTTNPSLVLKALSKPENQSLLQLAGQRVKSLNIPRPASSISDTSLAVDYLIVSMGIMLMKQIPGRVSAEVDPRLSFYSEATAQRARQLAAMFQAEGVPAERVLIKIAATWEGIQAAQQLELEGIRTNLTLVFSFAQAVACAQAKVQLISPFVGRIYDWHKKAIGPVWDEDTNSGLNDPGVKSVHAIYNHFKHFDIPTKIMGASFRNLGQILALSGCDLLTISPELLQQLAEYEQSAQAQLPDAQSLPNSVLQSDSLPATFPALSVEAAKAMDLQPVYFDEASFRWALNEDAMATEKLAEGIRAFAADTCMLEALIQAH
jgi:transaldolase